MTRCSLLLTAALLTAVPVIMAHADDKAVKDCASARDSPSVRDPYLEMTPEEKIAACTEVLARGAKTPLKTRADAFFYRGQLYDHRKDYERALSDYDAAIRLYPKNSSVYFYRSFIHRYQRKDLDRALADLTEAIRLDPSSTYFSVRASVYEEKGEFDRAVADLDTAIRNDPNSASHLIARGDVWLKKGDPERALADYEAALRVDPRSKFAADGRDKARVALATGKGLNQPTGVQTATALGNSSPASAPAPTPRNNVTEAIAPQATEPSAPKVALPAVPQEVATAPATPTPAPAVIEPKAAVVPIVQEARVALVIGNADYRAVSRLPNPPRDAAAIAEGLRRVGFRTVRMASNLSREGMITALRIFEQEANRADWAVVYYAGHGIEVGGMNYLIPVDARLQADKDVYDEAVSLERVLSAIENAKKLRLVILDACRDNPFIAGMKRSIASRSIGRGLAAVEPEGGVLVAYAAKHGQVALDGDGANSPFVASLVKRLDTPGLDISLLFRLVRDDVLVATGRRQEPYVYGSLPGEVLSFRPQ